MNLGCRRGRSAAAPTRWHLSNIANSASQIYMGAFSKILVVTSIACTLATSPALAEKRIALVIGNGAYAHAPPLPNPVHDAEDVTAALKRSGFDVISGSDLGQADMQESEIRFARAANSADVAVFCYSGHAMQFNGANYLMPIDAKLDDEADLKRFLRVDDILSDLQQQAKNLRILVLDSCRDNPLAEGLRRALAKTRGASLQRGLNKMEAPLGTIISFSTQAGQTADDGKGRNSPYTAAFLKHIEEHQEIGDVFRDISTDVYDVSGKIQLPELSLSIVGKFYLNGPGSVTINPPPRSAPADPCAAAEAHWKAADAIGSVAAYEDHAAKFQSCAFANLAKAKIDELKANTAAASPTDARASPPVKSKAFDGKWDVTVRCADASGALGYERYLLATVTNGTLHAEDPNPTRPPLAIDGDIGQDGKATLVAHGLTSNPPTRSAMSVRVRPTPTASARSLKRRAAPASAWNCARVSSPLRRSKLGLRAGAQHRRDRSPSLVWLKRPHVRLSDHDGAAPPWRQGFRAKDHRVKAPARWIALAKTRASQTSQDVHLPGRPQLRSVAHA